MVLKEEGIRNCTDGHIETKVVIFKHGYVTEITHYLDSLQYGPNIKYHEGTRLRDREKRVKQESYFSKNSDTGYKKIYSEDGFLLEEIYIVEGKMILSISYYKPKIMSTLTFDMKQMIHKDRDYTDSIAEANKSNAKLYYYEGGGFKGELYDKTISPKRSDNSKNTPFYVSVKKGSVKEIYISSGSIDTIFKFTENPIVPKESINDDSIMFQSKNHIKGFECELLKNGKNRSDELFFFKEYASYGRVKRLNISGGEKAGYAISFDDVGMIHTITMLDDYGNGKILTIESGEKSFIHYRRYKDVKEYFNYYKRATVIAFIITMLYHIFFFVNRKRRRENMRCPDCGKVQKFSYVNYIRFMFKQGSCKQCKTGLKLQHSRKSLLLKFLTIYPLSLPIIYIIYLTKTELNMPFEVFPELYVFIVVLGCLYLTVLRKYRVLFEWMEKK